MMSNFIYALRKRWSVLKGKGHINTWLTWHQFVGFMSPVLICFHAAFQSNNLLATAGNIRAFWNDLVLRGLDDRVVITLWSEFGRRPAENGSGELQRRTLQRQTQGGSGGALAAPPAGHPPVVTGDEFERYVERTSGGTE